LKEVPNKKGFPHSGDLILNGASREFRQRHIEFSKVVFMNIDSQKRKDPGFSKPRSFAVPKR